jgi:hypothetical protein
MERVHTADVEMAPAPESKEVLCAYHHFRRPVIEPAPDHAGAAGQAAIATAPRLFCVDVKQGDHKTKADDFFSQSACAETDRLLPVNLMEFSLPADPKAYPCSCGIPFSLVPTVSLRARDGACLLLTAVLALQEVRQWQRTLVDTVTHAQALSTGVLPFRYILLTAICGASVRTGQSALPKWRVGSACTQSSRGHSHSLSQLCVQGVVSWFLY